MRTIFAGTSDFAAEVLRRLADSKHRPDLVLTRPDRPSGRGRRLTAPPVADAARELGIELEQPESINHESARRRIAKSHPDAVCVCAFGAIIKEPLLSEHLMLNVHPSLLPRWRGAAPIERALINGDQRTGVSIMRLTSGLDSGPVCLQAVEGIEDDDTYGSLALRLQRIGGELLVRALGEPLACEEQDESGVCYAEKISAEDRMLDPADCATALERRVRALTPHIGAHVQLEDGTLLGVLQARVLAQAGPAAGTVDLKGPRPVLGCAKNALELTVVKPPGGRSMSGEDFLRGRAR